MKPIHIIPIITASLFASCANKFSEAQKQSLSTVAVAPGTLAEEAYQEPDGGDRAAAQAAAMAGVNSGTGAIGGALGSIIGESIAATQDSLYDAKNKQHYDRIQQITPNPAPILSQKLTKNLKDDSFFGQRLKPSSPNQFQVEVLNYGLVRASKTDEGEILVTPRVTARFSLVDGSGKTLFKSTNSATGYHHPIGTYVQDPRKLAESYEIAEDATIKAFLTGLSTKTAP
jgi:hypothetical protein